MPSRIRVGAALASATVLMLVVRVDTLSAQSLRGSRASINRMYRHAVSEKLHFYETAWGVRNAADKGVLVRLVPNEDFTIHAVSFPFVREPTRTFVHRLASQYRDACDEQLVVTSATRPESRQPANSTARSVHPTGMAVDLRKPTKGSCLRWLRQTLLELEDAGLLEATEEYGPPHFHVAVYLTPYRRYVMARTRGGRTVQLASSSDHYRVRVGDTLWDIARAHDTTVERIQEANHLGGSVITPGQDLVIPTDAPTVVSAGSPAQPR
jgi:hypothetical protein